jgi:hypothetical protein
MVREAVRDGEDLIEFMTAVLKGDAKRLGVRTVPLGYRMQAAEWFADRGFGKTPADVDMSEQAPQGPRVSLEEFRAWAERLPPALRAEIGRRLDAEFEAKINAEVAQAQAAARAKLPGPPIDIRDFVVMHRAEYLTIPGVRDVTLSDSYEVILEVDADVSDDRLTWVASEGRRLLGHPVVAKRRSR